MALISDFATAGAGIVTDYGVTTREYRVDGPGQFYELYKEEAFRETRVWVALTEAAAKGEVDNNDQPEDDDEHYSYAASEDRRIVGSYSLTRMLTKVTTTKTFTSEVFRPQFSPDAGTYSKPFTCTISSESDGAHIFAGVSEWVPQVLSYPGHWSVVTSGSDLGVTPKTITVPANTLQRTLHRVWAYAIVAVGSNEYKSATSWVNYYKAP